MAQKATRATEATGEDFTAAKLDPTAAPVAAAKAPLIKPMSAVTDRRTTAPRSTGFAAGRGCH